MIAATVVYALEQRQWKLPVQLLAPATVRDAIERCGLLQQFPRLLEQAPAVGIFHRRCDLHTLLCDGDQVQIYRPLQVDPKQARRQRVARARPR